jgi:hypothetical protein
MKNARKRRGQVSALKCVSGTFVEFGGHNTYFVNKREWMGSVQEKRNFRFWWREMTGIS